MYVPREHLEFAELYTLIEHSFQKSGMFSLPAVFYLFSDKYRGHYATLHSLSTIDGSSRTTFSG